MTFVLTEMNEILTSILIIKNGTGELLVLNGTGVIVQLLAGTINVCSNPATCRQGVPMVGGDVQGN